jgi:hypothetical protein
VTDPEPDVEMRFAVRARELRFERKPEVRVRAYANSPASAESASERHNLPDELEQGVTYRDFAVRWRAAARLRSSARAAPDDRQAPGARSVH